MSSSKASSGRTGPASRFFVFVRHPVVSGVLVAALVAVGGAAAQKFLGLPFGKGSPMIEIENLADGEEVGGAPPIRGKVSGYQPGQMVWSFNSPENTRRAYPDAGPCRIEDDSFTCRLTGLTIDEGHAAQNEEDFTLWVAVVSAEQAATFAEAKAEYDGQTPFVTMTDSGPAHVGSAVDSVAVTCLKGRGCPVSSSPSNGGNSPDPAPPARITSPRGGVLTGDTVVVTGTGANSDQLWLFDYDHNHYTRDNDAPLPIERQKWRFTNAGLEPGRQQIVLIDASASCANAITSIKPDSDNTFTVPALPMSCSIADRVTITIR